jgi:purine-nucleoside phosphorylase
MGDFLTLELIDAAVAAVQQHTKVKPRVGMILGSGLGPFADTVKNPEYVAYADIPGWPVSTVEGHVGRLVLGELEGQQVVIMQGRTHFYEGYPITRLGLPVRVMQRLGIEMVFITNAAGAVHPDYEPGDLMLLTDHLNLLGMAGQNPLRGPNLDSLGPRFPDMSKVYDRQLQALARQVAREEKITLHEGVYVCLAGPTFETPTDLRFLRNSGVDAVGMSTVPEAIVARHGGTRVMGISGISNKANLDGETETTHEEVLEAGRMLVPRLTKLLQGVLRRL